MKQTEVVATCTEEENLQTVRSTINGVIFLLVALANNVIIVNLIRSTSSSSVVAVLVV